MSSWGKATNQAVGASEDQLAWMRSAQLNYETAMPFYDFRSFAYATGYYVGPPLQVPLD